MRRTATANRSLTPCRRSNNQPLTPKPRLQEQGTLTGTADLFVYGNDLRNVITGNAGNNLLHGGGGDDRITGGDGDDILIGGPGRDTLIGGNGQDTFMYASVADGGDQISGFVSGTDRIVLSASMFADANVRPGLLDPSTFTVGARATNDSHRVIYDPNTRTLLFDPEGSGGLSPALFASFSSSTPISHGDIFIR